MNKNFAAITLAAALLTVSAQAKVSFSLDIEALSNSVGSPLSNSGLLVLVVDKDRNGFQGPVAGALVTGDDEIVTWWDLSEAGPGTTDITLLTEGGVTYGEDWLAGDPLALYWFPSLSASNLVPSADEEYGVFADVQNLASGDDWTMPPNGTLLHSLKLFTAAATKLVMFGDLPDFIGQTSYAVDNPPVAATQVAGLDAQSQGGKVALTWTAGAAPGGGFVVKRRVGTGQWETVGFAGSAATGYDDATVRGGLTYEYQVYAMNGISAPQPAASGPFEAERSVLASVAARSMMENAIPRRMYGQVDVLGNDPSKKLIIQASGPWLTGKIVGSPVLDPSMELYRHPNPDFSNRETIDLLINNWMEAANALAIDQVQADFGTTVHPRRVNVFEVGSKDASWLGDVQSGTAHTFAVNTEDGSQGPVHIGIYNAEASGTQFEPSDNRIVALATRGYLGTTVGHKMFGEFTIEGSVGVKKTVLIRGLGPNLANFPPLNDGDPLRAVVQDPSITLYYHPDPVANISNRVEIASNNDWETQVASAVTITDLDLIRAAEQYVLDFDPRQVAFAEGSKDALLFVELDPGVYTFMLDAPGTGIGLLGIYEVELDI